MTKKLYLIIDDNQDVRDYVKSLLHDKYTVIEASNGQKGLQQAMKYVPDAIICDVMMPVMDGLEAARYIRWSNKENARDIPIIAMTANAFTEDKERALESGMNDHVAKRLI